MTGLEPLLFVAIVAPGVSVSSYGGAHYLAVNLEERFG
jgi:hypothetical protein